MDQQLARPASSSIWSEDDSSELQLVGEVEPKALHLRSGSRKNWQEVYKSVRKHFIQLIDFFRGSRMTPWQQTNSLAYPAFGDAKLQPLDHSGYYVRVFDEIRFSELNLYCI